MKPHLPITIRHFKESAARYRCPLCRTPFLVTGGGSFLCNKNHCFDISKKGYVNFTARQKASGYSRELFLHRRSIFAGGFYETVLEKIESLLLRHAVSPVSAEALCVLDAGCGEGYYSRELSQREGLGDRFHFFAADLSKAAIRLAASSPSGEHAPVDWVVANLSNLPFQDQGFDFVLDILTPANYEEFGRVLKKDGKLIKVIPGSDYLKEIRSLLSGRLRREAYSNQQVADHMEHKFPILEKEKVRYSRPLTREQAASFLAMTPLTFGADISALPPEALSSITIDLDILLAAVPDGPVSGAF